MKARHLRTWILVSILLVGLSASVWGQSTASQSQITDPGWPRVFKQDGNQLTIYQPQVDSWDGYKTIHFRCAVAVTPASDKRDYYGIAEASADTAVDFATRTVVTRNHRRELRFPDLPSDKAAKLRQMADKILPMRASVTVSLDRVLAYLDTENASAQKAVQVDMQPPRIFYSSTPAILVIFMGEPELKPVTPNKTDLMCAINTNWDVFYSTPDLRYYLLNGDSWLTAPDAIKGTWTPSGRLPAALSTLPADDNWADVRSHLPGKQVSSAPMVITATEPCELIVTRGEPSFSPIPGTRLMRVANTDSPLFLHTGEGQYYFLVAGRWFRAKNLTGPWSSASMDLPADFSNIPADSPAAYVKASVPHTREAEDAVLLASVPTSTTLNRTAVNLQVIYDGEPKFEPIQGTSVWYAVNTSYDVFLVGGAYYWCYQGAWLTSAAAKGPWTFATTVPAAIYTIPPTHPAYNVTYVTVANSTPTTVTYNYTSGYSGEYVASNGVLMFGIGMLIGAAIADEHDDYYYYHGPWYSYGCGAVYHYGYGGYYRAARVYGPYGGAGCVAAYNPYTGRYSRGAYAYGPAGSASFRQAYNPYTGGYAQVSRINTAYGSAGRFYAQQGGKSAWGGYRSNAYGSAGGIVTSEGTGIAGWDTARGQGGIAKDKEGNVYAGKDGTIYKRDENGDWSKYSGNGGWESVDKQRPTETRPGTDGRQSGQTRPGTDGRQPGQTRPGTDGRQPGGRQYPNRGQMDRSNPTVQNLDRQAQARSWGNRQSQYASGFRSGRSTPLGSGFQRSRPSSSRPGIGRRR